MSGTAVTMVTTPAADLPGAFAVPDRNVKTVSGAAGVFGNGRRA